MGQRVGRRGVGGWVVVEGGLKVELIGKEAASKGIERLFKKKRERNKG